MALVGTRKINNMEVEIHASVHGTWSIRMVGEEGNSGHLAMNEDLNKAINNARIAIKKRDVEIHVPFRTLAGERGIARGRHAKTRDILVTIDGQKDTMSGYSKVLKPDTPKETMDLLNELHEESKRIDRERREIMKQWEMDLSTAVTSAMDQAATEAAAKENTEVKV